MARAAAFRRGPFPARAEQGTGCPRLAYEKSRHRLDCGRKLFLPVFPGLSRRAGAPAPEKSGISLERDPRLRRGRASCLMRRAMKYLVAIGLETHVQLKTQTKMFCGCHLTTDDPPNTNVCPVCLGYPGALPLANRKAIQFTVMSGLMLGCEINRHSEFDRKKY